jgi:hypothetical protein
MPGLNDPNQIIRSPKAVKSAAEIAIDRVLGRIQRAPQDSSNPKAPPSVPSPTPLHQINPNQTFWDKMQKSGLGPRATKYTAQPKTRVQKAQEAEAKSRQLFQQGLNVPKYNPAQAEFSPETLLQRNPQGNGFQYNVPPEVIKNPQAMDVIQTFLAKGGNPAEIHDTKSVIGKATAIIAGLGEGIVRPAVDPAYAKQQNVELASSSGLQQAFAVGSMGIGGEPTVLLEAVRAASLAAKSAKLAELATKLEPLATKLASGVELSPIEAGRYKILTAQVESVAKMPGPEGQLLKAGLQQATGVAKQGVQDLKAGAASQMPAIPKVKTLGMAAEKAPKEPVNPLAGAREAIDAAPQGNLPKIPPAATTEATGMGKVAEGAGLPPKKPRTPLWAKAGGEGIPPEKPPTVVAGTPELPSGRTPGSIKNMRPAEPAPTDYERLQTALTETKTPVGDKIRQTRDSIMTKFYDRNYPLKELERETGIRAHTLTQIVPGATAAGEDVLRTKVRPIYQSIKGDTKNLEQYMTLMRNEDILAHNPEAKLPGGIRGWAGNLQAKDAFKAKIGEEQFKTIETAAKDLWATHNTEVLDYYVKNGIISSSAANAMKTSHPHYIPFERADFSDMIQQTFARPEANVSSAGIKKMLDTGSERALDQPLAHFEADFIKAKQIVARNTAAKSTVEALLEMEKLTGDNLVTVLSDASKAEHSKVLDTITFLKDGKPVVVQVPAEYAAVAKSLGYESGNFLVNLLQKLGQPLAKGATTYNPAFLIVNPMRDAMSAWFREGLIPMSPDYLKGWFSVIRKDASFSEAAQSGALTSGLVDTMKSADAFSRAQRLGAFTVKSPQDALLLVPRLIEHANVTGEQATRVATYLRAKSQGFDSLEAALKARDVTVDFSKAGTSMKVINQVVPFSNAGVQGAANVIRTWKDEPLKALARSAPFGAVSIMTWANNQRFETGKKIPWYEYMQGWPIQIGEGTDKDGNKFPIYVKIPKGPQGAAITLPVEWALGTAQRQNDYSPVELLWQAGSDMVQVTSPVDTSAAGVLPPLLKTGVGLQTGKSLFTNLPIVPQGEQNRLPEQQFGKESSKVAVLLGQQFHISPRKIDFAIQDYTAGTGELGKWMLGMGLEAIGYNPKPYGGATADTNMTTPETLANTPLTRRFVGVKDTQDSQVGYNDFGKISTDTARAFSQLSGMNDLGISLGQVGNSLSGLSLDASQRAGFQQKYWDTVNPELEALISSSSYQQLPDEVKKYKVSRVLSRAKELAQYDQIATLNPADYNKSSDKALAQALKDTLTYDKISYAVKSQMNAWNLYDNIAYLESTNKVEDAKRAQLIKKSPLYKQVEAEISKRRSTWRKMHYPEGDKALILAGHNVTPPK